MKHFDDLEDAIAHARENLEDDECITLCRFPDDSEFCGNRHDMDNCPHCIRIDAGNFESNEYFAKIVKGGN